MHGVAGGRPVRALYRRRRLCEILVVSAAHCLAIPVGCALCRDAKSAVVQSLERIGDDRMCTVLVADYGNHGDLPEQDRNPVVIGAGRFRVQSFQGALSDARRVSQPRRRSEDEDICGHDFLGDTRPGVAAAHICFHTGHDVEVDEPDGVDGSHTGLFEFLKNLRYKQIGARFCWSGFERAVEG